MTTVFLIYEIIASRVEMSDYVSYILEICDSTFIHEQYHSQLVATQLSQVLNSPPSVGLVKPVYANIDAVPDTQNLTLDSFSSPLLHGVLNSSKADRQAWVDDIPMLQKLDHAIVINDLQLPYETEDKSFKGSDYYYVDIMNNYIYSYNKSGITGYLSKKTTPTHFIYNIAKIDLSKHIDDGDSIFSTPNNHNPNDNFINFTSPVYLHGKLKGVVVASISQQDLADMFKSHMRLRSNLWRYINISTYNSNSTHTINIKKSEKNYFNYINNSKLINKNIRVDLSVDITYLIVSSWKLITLYLLLTIMLLHFVWMHFRVYYNVSKENISDTLTSLYNRKVLTKALELRLQNLAERGVNILFISMDCDRLKYINDTFGHKEGDNAIIMIADAISASLRKGDYAIRMGGDEFILILIDYQRDYKNNAKHIAERIQKHISIADTHDRVHFSWGEWEMRSTDSIDDAIKASDLQLYNHKKSKRDSSQ